MSRVIQKGELAAQYRAVAFCVCARREKEKNEKWLSGARSIFIHTRTSGWRKTPAACLFWTLLIPGAADDDEGSFCPQVFDGWSCWARTAAGSVAELPCPYFITGFDPSSEYWFLRFSYIPESWKVHRIHRAREIKIARGPSRTYCKWRARERLSGVLNFGQAQMVWKFSTAASVMYAACALILEIDCIPRGISLLPNRPRFVFPTHYMFVWKNKSVVCGRVFFEWRAWNLSTSHTHYMEQSNLVFAHPTSLAAFLATHKVIHVKNTLIEIYSFYSSQNAKGWRWQHILIYLVKPISIEIIHWANLSSLTHFCMRAPHSVIAFSVCVWMNE